MKIKTLFVMLTLLAGSALITSADIAELVPDHDYAELESLIIQQGGRKKPLLTFSREVLLTLSGRSSLNLEDKRVDSMAFIASIWINQRDWSEQPIINVESAEVKEALGLDMRKHRFAFRDIVGAETFQRLVAEMEETREVGGDEAMTEKQRKLNEVVARLNLFQSLQTGRAFAVIPHPSDPVGRWVSLGEAETYYTEQELVPLGLDWVMLHAAYHGEPISRNFTEASVAFRERQAALSPEVMLSGGLVRAELLYEKVPFFRLAWILCLLTTLAFGLTWKAGRKTGSAIGWSLALAALAAMTVGMALRVYISGRAPVTNMYETVIWVAFGAMLFAVIFEMRHRCRYYFLSAAPVATLMLILADSVPSILDPNIAPLTAVLRDNFWLTTHVLIVTISYAAFALAWGLGHYVLFRKIVGGPKAPENKFIHAYIYRAMQVGLLLLIAGVILGGVWANYSWGRFWGWDPKETWALIAILCYLFVLHGRLVGWWKGFGISVGSVVGFLSILMCWYGVNFILGAGLHSYGFGTGGTGYAIAFVVAELAFVAAALFRHYQAPPAGRRRVSEPNAAPAKNLAKAKA